MTSSLSNTLSPTPALADTINPSRGSHRWRRTAMTAIAPMVWGTTYLVTTELLPPGHPIFAGAMRALPAGLLALAIARKLPHGHWWWRSLVLGALNIGIFFPLLFIAAQRLPGGVAATLGAAQPLLVAVLAVPILREKLTRWRLLWGVVGLVGVALVVLRPDARFDLAGIAAGLLGAVSMAVGVTLTKRWGRPAGVGVTALAGWQLTAGGLILAPLALSLEGIPAQIDPSAMLGYLWLSLLGGFTAYLLWFRGVSSLPAASTALLGLLSPLMAALLGVIFLNQFLSGLQLLGFSLALTALLAGQLSPPSRS